jgi:type IV secretion system protein VirB1
LGGFPRVPGCGVLILSAYAYQKASSLVPALLAEACGRAVRIMGEGQPALLATLSAYNTGTFTGGFANGYVAKYVPESRPPIAPRVETVSTRCERRSESA